MLLALCVHLCRIIVRELHFDRVLSEIILCSALPALCRSWHVSLSPSSVMPSFFQDAFNHFLSLTIHAILVFSYYSE